jgi:hypothetical protein
VRAHVTILGTFALAACAPAAHPERPGLDSDLQTWVDERTIAPTCAPGERRTCGLLADTLPEDEARAAIGRRYPYAARLHLVPGVSLREAELTMLRQHNETMVASALRVMATRPRKVSALEVLEAIGGICEALGGIADIAGALKK